MILENNICVSFIISRENVFGQHSFSILSTCMMDVRFRTPANFYICRQSQCGKSHLVKSMLYHLEELFDPATTKIIYCYGEYQTVFNDMMHTMPNISFVEGLSEDLYDMLYVNSLLIVDDLMSQCSQSQRMSNLFTKGSHSHYMVVFKNPRDSPGISTLASQMYPKHTNYLLESFHDATSKPYGYLLMDLLIFTR